MHYETSKIEILGRMVNTWTQYMPDWSDAALYALGFGEDYKPAK